tara:strand:+ start:53 stop:652 length:600 start_codon:yes stop_codon:yes gene_type:complete
MPYNYMLYLKISGNSPEETKYLKKYYSEKAHAWNKEIKKNKYCDIGFDLICPRNTSFQVNTSKLVDLSVHCAAYKVETKAKITDDGSNPKNTSTTSKFVPQGYYLYPRSSIYKTNFRLANSVGIIDPGYRGSLRAAVDCRNYHEDQKPDHNTWGDDEVMKKGNRYFQICMPTLKPFKIKIVENLDETERGEGGHGSTGQ